jgi:hypothetical protein
VRPYSVHLRDLLQNVERLKRPEPPRVEELERVGSFLADIIKRCLPRLG